MSEVKKVPLPRFQLSTGGLSEADRVDWFREVYGREMLQVDLTPFEKGGLLRADMNLVVLPSVRIADGDIDPMRCDHLVHLADNDDFVFAIVQRGVGQWHRKGQEADVTVGQGILTATGDAASFVAPIAMGMTNFRFNRQKIAERVTDAEAALARPVHQGNEALRLLRGYARVLEDPAILSSPDLCQAVDDHLHDLVAMILGPTREAFDVANSRGIRAARYRAIRDDIIANINRRELSIAFLTARHGVSERHIRGLFEGGGTTFTDFVLEQRLMRIHRMVRDYRHLRKSISAIAYECGIGDLSHFNRAFRARFGETPSRVRAEAWLDRGETGI